MVLPGQGTSSTAKKVKGVALCSILLNITCQILSMILMMGVLKELMENLKEFAEQSGQHDVEFPDASTMMVNNLPSQLVRCVVALSLPAAGFFGASRMHKELIMMFFACSFLCACCQTCNCVMLAGIATVAGPVGDKFMYESQFCNVYTRCKVDENPDQHYNKTIDCIAASIWPQYERQFPNYGQPVTPEKCGAVTYDSLTCYKTNHSNFTASTISMASSSSLSRVPSVRPDPTGKDIEAEIRRLLSKPVTAFDQAWAHSLSLAFNGKPRRLDSPAHDELAPSMPGNPLQACEVDVQHTKTFSNLLDLVEAELPTIKAISVISMLISLLTACVNCAGGFFGKQLHQECSVQTIPPIRAGSFVAPIAPQTMMTGGVSVLQHEMQTVPMRTGSDARL